MKLHRSSFALVLFLFLSLPLYATNWYVDGAVNSSGNGQSWATAWKAFSNINWSSIQPGDFIFISGGTDSKVYTSGLSVGKSGTPGNLITITGSYEANHNGKVIIQGSGWSGTGVSCVGDSYIRIANVHIRLWYVGINGGNSNVLYWDSVYVNKCQWAASPCTQGSGSDSVFIRWSRIVSDSTTATQTDALSCTNVTNLEVSNCYIYQGNRYASSGHSDIMQVRQSGRQLYYNNWFEEEGSELDSSAAAGLNGQINYAGDSTLFYNNVMIKRGWSYNTYMDQGNTGHVWLMYNNTFINEYTYGQGGVYQTQQIYSFAKNNIFMSLSNYGSMMIGTLSPGRSNFDYNQYYSPNASGIFGSNNPASFSSWQSQGGDINGAAGNPLFTDRENLDLTLQGGSPCINAGTAEIKAYIESYKYSGGYLPWTDYNGNPRSETAPSIGAYENATIPVELTSFTATSQIDKIILNWVTATETNNLGFEIDRKQNNSEWEKIGFVEGHGTTTEPKKYNYTDNDLFSGGSKFQYRLKQIDTDGQFEYSYVVEVEVVPTQIELSQNYPNPFNPSTKIRYQLPNESKVVIKIYNILGSEVMELVNDKKEAGIYEVEFNASNLSSGTYIYKMSAENFYQTKKMLLIK